MYTGLFDLATKGWINAWDQRFAAQ